MNGKLNVSMAGIPSKNNSGSKSNKSNNPNNLHSNNKGNNNTGSHNNNKSNDKNKNSIQNKDLSISGANGHNLSSPATIKNEDSANARPGQIQHPSFTRQLPISGLHNQPQVQFNQPMPLQQHMVNPNGQFPVNGMDQQFMNGGVGVPPQHMNGVPLMQQIPNKIAYGPPSGTPQANTPMDPNLPLLQPQNGMGSISGPSAPTSGPLRSNSIDPSKQPLAGGKKQAYNRPVQSPLNKPVIIGANPMMKEQELFQQDMNAKIYKRNLGNAGLIRVLDLIDQISNESTENLSNIEYWQRVVQVFFLPSSIFKFNFNLNGQTANGEASSLRDRENSALDPSADNPGANSNEQYELNAITAPRFFVASILSGNVETFKVTLPSLKFQVLGNGSLFIVSKVSIQYTYKDGSLATVGGNLKLLMNREFRIEFIDVQCLDYNPSISFMHLENHWQKYMESKKRKKLSGSNADANEFFDTFYKTTEAARNANRAGISSESLRVMQVSDVMSLMRSLMGFSTVNNVNSPLKALEMFMASNANPPAVSQNQAPGKQQSTMGSQKKNSMSAISPLTTYPEDTKSTLKKRKLSSLESNIGSPLTGKFPKEANGG